MKVSIKKREHFRNNFKNCYNFKMFIKSYLKLNVKTVVSYMSNCLFKVDFLLSYNFLENS